MTGPAYGFAGLGFVVGAASDTGGPYFEEGNFLPGPRSYSLRGAVDCLPFLPGHSVPFDP